MKVLFRLLCCLTLQSAFAQTPSQATRPDTLPLTDRIWGLTSLWHEVKLNFAYYDKLNFNWDSTYRATLATVARTPDRYAYYQVLRRLGARLHDGHTNVYLPADLREQHLAGAPVRLQLLEGRVFVEKVLNDSLQAYGLHPGVEITAINGQPVWRYGETTVRPYVSASTEQDAQNRTYTNELLAGNKRDTLHLTIRMRNNRQRTVALKRGMSNQRLPYPALGFRFLTRQRIGVIALNTFDNDSLLPHFAALLPQLRACKALIIDLRKNGGGNGDYAYTLQSYFFARGYQDTQGHTRTHTAAWQAFGLPRSEGWLDIPVSTLWIPVDTTGGKLLQPVVLLTSAKTFSAAEDFTATLKQNKRAITIGSATGGSTGLSITHPLPGGGSFRVTVKRDTFADGTPFIGVGVQPDISRQSTVRNMEQQQDPALEAAINYLSSKSAK